MRENCVYYYVILKDMVNIVQYIIHGLFCTARAPIGRLYSHVEFNCAAVKYSRQDRTVAEERERQHYSRDGACYCAASLEVSAL